MKKKSALIALVLPVVLLLSSCSGKADVVTTSDGKKISFYMTQEEAEKIIGRGRESEVGEFGSIGGMVYDEGLIVYYRADNPEHAERPSGIAAMQIIHKNFEGPLGVSIGDDKVSVLAKFKYEMLSDYGCSVVFKDGKEIDRSKASGNDFNDYIMADIIFDKETDSVKTIQMFDRTFITTLS